MKRGFLTAVMDLPHRGHFQLLRAARQFCDILIVGLTTDERCQQEKRTPFMKFEQRKEILENCKWVDLVVENKGQTKQQMYQNLKFDVLFSTEEYVNKPEFESFRKEYPEVPVIFFPTTSGIRTTEQIQRIESDILQSLQVLSIGISGPVLLLDRRDSKVVMKPICIGATEAMAQKTSNCYHMPVPPPRNWRGPGEVKRFPNISGVNAWREVEIMSIIKDKPWNPFIRFVESYENTRVSSVMPQTQANFQHVNDERKVPVKMLWLQQRYGGMCLFDWIRGQQDTTKITTLLCKIRAIIEQELIPQGILHGDIHAFNVCVDEQDHISLIDWGWCLSRSFALQEDERKYLEECLASQWDWVHLCKSLRFDFPDSWSKWLPDS